VGDENSYLRFIKGEENTPNSLAIRVKSANFELIDE
jgi:hypothetical protein